jgi:hypothetical protein
MIQKMQVTPGVKQGACGTTSGRIIVDETQQQLHAMRETEGKWFKLHRLKKDEQLKM